MIKFYNDELHVLSESQITIFDAMCEINRSVITTFGSPHVRSDAYLTETNAGICGPG